MALDFQPSQLQQLIPQRPPFVLVDRLYNYGATEIISGFTVPEGHMLVNHAGCFSEAGIMEHFAQTIALHKGYDYFLKRMHAPMGYIGSIRNMQIYSLPKIGEELRTHIRIEQELMDITLVSGTVSVGDLLIASGEMKTVIAKEI